MVEQEAGDVLRRFVKLKCALMPYLYSQAVKTHEEGIPLMRPMFLEFPEDRCCETLDKQYMLGDSLLVAPVFRESGEVEYYLPKGNWINILTGKTLTGGGWQKESHDYFTLPLLVRPGSIIPAGGNCDRPDYDYADGVNLLLYFPDEGSKAEASVTDVRGCTVMEVRAERTGAAIKLRVEGRNENFTWEVLGDDELTVMVE